MRVWRIARAVHGTPDGEGARLYGGRWNSPGRAVVYTASSRALAVLERLVATDPEELPDDLALFDIDIPEEAVVESVSSADLPPAWQRPRNPQCRRTGDEWLVSARSLVLAVPSAVVPEEPNLLINPTHPDAPAVQVAAERPFTFDARLLE